MICAPFASALFVAYSLQIAHGLHRTLDADFCFCTRLRRPSHGQRRAVLDVVKALAALDPAGFGLDDACAQLEGSGRTRRRVRRRTRTAAADAGYMRLVKDRILYVWEQRRAEAKDRTAEQERRVKAIQQKLDRLDEAFLYAESIDLTTYGRQRDKLREELTLAKIDHHAEAVDELDVEGILAFAERILPRASDLWVQASLDYKQRLQQLFFPEGIAFDGNRFNRTAVTAPLFKYLAPSESADEKMDVRSAFAKATADNLRVACQP